MEDYKMCGINLGRCQNCPAFGYGQENAIGNYISLWKLVHSPGPTDKVKWNQSGVRISMASQGT